MNGLFNNKKTFVVFLLIFLFHFSDPPRITEADIISSNVWHLAHYHEGSREGLWSDASVRDQWLRSIRIYYKSAAGLNIFMENG